VARFFGHATAARGKWQGKSANRSPISDVYGYRHAAIVSQPRVVGLAVGYSLKAI
jgi:hypothetical protein